VKKNEASRTVVDIREDEIHEMPVTTYSHKFLKGCSCHTRQILELELQTRR